MSRIRGLDGVRAFAVLVVIAAHAHLPLLHGGGVGVDIFFGLSGFLITYLLLQEHARFGVIDLRKFWLRRVLRLLPALIVMVGAVDALAIASLIVSPSQSLVQALMATPGVLLYFRNWLIVWTSSPALGWFGPLWSLAVEEQFYLLWPVVVIVSLRAKRGVRILAALAALIAGGACVGRFFTFDGSDMYRTFGTDFRVDMLLIGAILAIIAYSGNKALLRRVSSVLVVPAVALILAAVVVMPDFNSAEGAEFQRWYYWVGLPLVGLSTATLISYLLTHSHGGLASALEWRPLAYSGRISYGMYLWHYPILMGIASATRSAIDPLPLFLLGLAGTYAMAASSYRFVERPLQRRLHQRLRPSDPLIGSVRNSNESATPVLVRGRPDGKTQRRGPTR